MWQIKDENNNTILHKSCFDNNTGISIIIIKELKKRLGSASLLSTFIKVILNIPFSICEFRIECFS